MMSIEEKKQWIKDNFEKISKIYLETEAHNYECVEEYVKIGLELGGEEVGFLDFIKEHEDTMKNYANINYFLSSDSPLLKDECSNCKEEVCGINISDSLKLIRNDEEKENSLFLYINDGKILDRDIFTSNQSYTVNFIDKYDSVLEKAINLKADLYNVHNHPLSIDAKPSEGDLRYFKGRVVRNANDKGIKYLDFGVVTAFDYYSHKQKGKL